MQLAVILSCRHRLGADPALALTADRELVAAVRTSADAVVLEHSCAHGEHWTMDGISYAGYLAEGSAPLAAVVRGLPLGVSNPVELAEALGTLDHAWAGRFAAGLVLAPPALFAAHGKDPALADARVAESLSILAQMWAGQPFAAHGEVFRFAEVRPTLLPYTHGGPPLSLSIADAGSAALAARHGLGVHLAATSPERRLELISAYREAGGAAEVIVEVGSDDPVEQTVAELVEWEVTGVELRLPRPPPGLDLVSIWADQIGNAEPGSRQSQDR